jgi:hypothetical protein
VADAGELGVQGILEYAMRQGTIDYSHDL